MPATLLYAQLPAATGRSGLKQRDFNRAAFQWSHDDTQSMRVINDELSHL